MTRARKPVSQMSTDEILDALAADDYACLGEPEDVANAIKASARNGTLVWTAQHIVSVDHACARTIESSIRKVRS